MTDRMSTDAASAMAPDKTSAGQRLERKLSQNIAARKRAETRFYLYGLVSVAMAILFLIFLLGNLFVQGISVLQQTAVRLDITLDAKVIDPEGDRNPEILAKANYGKLVKQALGAQFPDVKKRGERRALNSLISTDARSQVRSRVLDNPDLIGTRVSVWVWAGDDVDTFMKGNISRDVAEGARTLSDRQIEWIDELLAAERLELKFNTNFFFNGDSREPELAGIASAVVGSFFSLVVCFFIACPIGVLTAVYLEEFAGRNRWTDLVEINISNLAAVPSIVFGLLGLAIFLNFFGLPRSAPLVGGMVLALMTLPTVVIASRAALQAVPPSIREAALAVGASRVQMVFHHVVPLAVPGIMTGTIIGMARALGETAPLLMIGMVAFIVDVPQSIVDPATALPVQIFLWADAPERAFQERTAGAVMVLLAFLLLMNFAALYLRQKFEHRW